MIKLVTLPGQKYDGSADTFVLVQKGLMGDWTLCYSDVGRITKPTLEKIFFALAGMVEWNRWSPETQAWLLAHNNGKPIW